MVGKKGFWRVDYRNDVGDGGYAIMVFDTGAIVGTDAWAGSGMEPISSTSAPMWSKWRWWSLFPPEVFSAVTGKGFPQGHSETYAFKLPNALGREVPFELTIAGRPMAVRFKKIREFPT
jgi:hypothetical protein